MSQLIKTIFGSIQEAMGRPASLQALLSIYPDLSAPLDEQARNISAEVIVRDVPASV